MFGVQGWVRVQSFTRPVENILDYSQWWIGGVQRDIEEIRPHRGGFVAKLAALADRELAAALTGEEVQVPRGALPAPPAGQYYWSDLVDMEVVCEDGTGLGKVDRLLENGAQDVLVIRGERERLVPFVSGPIVKAVDLASRRIVVDWAPDY